MLHMALLKYVVIWLRTHYLTISLFPLLIHTTYTPFNGYFPSEHGLTSCPVIFLLHFDCYDWIGDQPVHNFRDQTPNNIWTSSTFLCFRVWSVGSLFQNHRDATEIALLLHVVTYTQKNKKLATCLKCNLLLNSNTLTPYFILSAIGVSLTLLKQASRGHKVWDKIHMSLLSINLLISYQHTLKIK